MLDLERILAAQVGGGILQFGCRCGAWSDKRAPFRRAARWDGVVAICGSGEDRAIRPDEVSAIRSYMERYRTSDDPFDLVVILWSDGDRSAAELEETSR